jgi:hypothetical protein
MAASGAVSGSRLRARVYPVNTGFKNVRANGDRVKAAPLQGGDPFDLASEAALQGGELLLIVPLQQIIGHPKKYLGPFAERAQSLSRFFG